ncbi:hypothetical protein Gotur_010799 [Gossypium turneri]
MSSYSSLLLENYLREASFWHRVYHHFGGRVITIEIDGGWVRTHRVTRHISRAGK